MTPSSLSAVSLLTGPSTHLDHLGIFSHLLGMPLFVTEPQTLETAKTYYPEFSVVYKDLYELSAPYLSENFSYIAHSARKMSGYFTDLFSLFSEKMPRLIYCPHGNSDKEHSLQEQDQPLQDIVFVYGQHMLDLLETNGALKKINKTFFLGNYRYSFYKENQAFYDALVQEKVFRFLSKENITLLYAPTWTTKEYQTSFFEMCPRLIEQKPRDWNLIIKPHPLLKLNDPGKTWHLLLSYQDRKDVIFLDDFPPIYPLLEKCDLFLGDFSSVSYDFLTFDRPMFFFSPKEKILERGLYLHSCGMQIPEERLNSLYAYMEENLEKNREAYSSLRKKVYAYTFAPHVSFAKVKEELSLLTPIRKKEEEEQKHGAAPVNSPL